VYVTGTDFERKQTLSSHAWYSSAPVIDNVFTDASVFRASGEALSATF
jgi:hypothetical protein